MFNQEIFDSMLAGGAYDKAANYLKTNRKMTVKGKPSTYAVRLSKARKRNHAKMRSRNRAAFSGVYVVSSDVCKECGKPAEVLDHIIPHTKARHIKASVVRRICLKLQTKILTVAEFVRSYEHNGQKLCATCNENKKSRENSVTWTDEYAVARFFYAEKGCKIKGFKASEQKREILAKYMRVILRARRNIAIAERQNKPSKAAWNTLKGIEKRVNRELRAAGQEEITL